MKDREKSYDGQDLSVTYNARRCIHFAACVRGLPAVFDPDKRPWIEPSQAAASEIIDIVQQCPTGALHVYRDQQLLEQANTDAQIRVQANGPLFLRGQIELRNEAGELIVTDTRIALCRCGQSHNKPFCDGSHRQAFRNSAELSEVTLPPFDQKEGRITITVSAKGPYRIRGPLSIIGSGSATSVQAEHVNLCRCGASQHKPFCDGSHTTIDPEVFHE